MTRRVASFLNRLIVACLLLYTLSAVAGGNNPVPTDEPSARPAVSGKERSGDRIKLPPTHAEFLSRDRRYRFVVSTPDRWKSKQGRGLLTRIDSGGESVVWDGLLPQEYGPRYVLVGREGSVLLLDEWINVKSRYAVVVLIPNLGAPVQYDFDAVQALLDVPAKTIVRMAKGGWWISAQPTLDADGATAWVHTAGKVLKIDLRTGALSL